MSTTSSVPLAIACLMAIAEQAPGQERDPAQVVRGPVGRRVDELMTAAAAQGFSGVVLIARPEGIVLSRGYGLANQEQDIKVTSQTVFDIGSITKQFTAAAILNLELEGELRTDDAIDRFFDGVPADKAGITLEHLLTHSAGLPDAIGGDYQKINRDEFVRKALSAKLRSKPGERYRYSNVGYSLLGAIIEKLTANSYEHYLHDSFFAPLGMNHTGYVIPQWKPERLAHGYGRRGRDTGTPLDHPWAGDGPYWHLRANGGILSTTADLFTWHTALAGGKILSPESLKKLVTPRVPEGPGADSYYAYGWVVVETPRKTTLITHNGGNGIFFADFLRYVDEDTVIIVASNRADHSVERYGRAIREAVFGP